MARRRTIDEPSPYIPAPVEFTVEQQQRLDVLSQTQHGINYILQAIALHFLKEHPISSSADYPMHTEINEFLGPHMPRIEEIMRVWQVSWSEFVSLIFLNMSVQPQVRDSAIELEKLAQLQNVFPIPDPSMVFRAVLVEMGKMITAKEQLAKTKLVMIAGQQGSGKGTAAKALESIGFTVLSYSTLVRAVTLAWELDQTQTVDKIVVGQVFKEYFGPDILTELAVYNSIYNQLNDRMTPDEPSEYLISIDGPRLVEEAEAVVAMGGLLIGVIADPDQAIDRLERKRRITTRSGNDKSREADSIQFDSREEIEYEKIQAILNMCTNIVVNNGDSQHLVQQVQNALTQQSW